MDIARHLTYVGPIKGTRGAIKHMKAWVPQHAVRYTAVTVSWKDLSSSEMKIRLRSDLWHFAAVAMVTSYVNITQW